MKRISILPLLAAGLIILSGCGSSEHADITEWMNEQAKDMRGRVKAPPPLYTPPIVSYSAEDRLSPFSSDKAKTKEGGVSDRPGGGADHVAQYLESFPLESLKLIGVITYNGKVYALIQTPEKPKHVTIGDYIGQNYGKIVEIAKGEVKVIETVKDANDIWVKRQKSLFLQVEGEKK